MRDAITFLKCNQHNTLTQASQALNDDDIAQLAGGGSLYRYLR